MKPIKKEVDWKECFGSGRQYTLLMVKSQHEPIRFAAKLAKLYQRDFSFIADYAPDPENHPDIAFATYFSIIDAAKNINMLVMANHTPVPASDHAAVQNPLLGLSLFDENFYFFNFKKDNRLFRCELKNYDFLVFLYSDKDYPSSDITKILENQPSFLAEDVSDFLLPDVQKNEARKRISVLQNLIEYFGVMMNNIQEDRMRVRLGNKGIPMTNYVHRRFQIDQVITSPLVDREDV